MSVRSFASTAILGSLVACSNGSTGSDSVRTITPQPEAEQPETLAGAIGDYHREILALLESARMEYPVPYVRQQLEEILAGVADGSVVVETILTTEPAYSHLYARYRTLPDGRPVIQYFFMAGASFVAALVAQVQSMDRSVIDPLLTDWYVHVTLHEWSHYRLGHRFDESVTPAIHARQESEAWATVLEHVIHPAIQFSRFTVPLGDEVVYGYACWIAANGYTVHPAWQAFVQWITHEGPAEALEPLCVDAFVDAMGAPAE